jgi:hypothetical protein
MPLLITPAEPIITRANVPLSSLYAIIDAVSYQRKGWTPKVISAQIGYYYDEAASLSAEQVPVEGWPTSLAQEATPEQANTLPIFEFLEALLKAKLEAVLPAGTRIEVVA